MMRNPRQTLGQRSEAFVAQQLRRAGYTIRETNWRHGRLGELDIVAQQADTLVFVEVRARSGPLEDAIGAALASVRERKQARLLQLAQVYLAEHELEGMPWRIDVAAVAYQRGTLAVEMIRDAIEW